MGSFFLHWLFIADDEMLSELFQTLLNNLN